MNDIIVAIATAKSESAIGIIRMSGQGCIDIADKVFRAKNDKKLSDFSNRYMAYGKIYDVSLNKSYDEVMAVYMKAPYTYTKEDIVEIYTHGNYIIMTEILKLLISLGARLADAGEFTKRAFLSGRIDLTQAEAIMDMVGAKTKKGFEIAKTQLEGSLGRSIEEICENMTTLLAKIEVTIDYPDEDIEMIEKREIVSELENINSVIYKLLNTYQSGKIIKEGLSLAIVGKPNAGKSSILNTILNEDRAIVSNIAGTTRDIITEDINIRGIKISAIDTAGIRETDDFIEKIGVEKSKKVFNDSDIILFVMDISKEIEKEDMEIIEKIGQKPCIICLNKSDLPKKLDIEKLKSILCENVKNFDLIETSTVNKIGIDDIENCIEKIVINDNIILKDSMIITNIRHYEALYNANECIKTALNSIKLNIPIDVIEVDLQNAYSYLGAIVGKTVSEDVITRIFERFCLGK